jgi:hypothetical protein
MDPQIAAIDYEHFFSAKMMRTNVGTGHTTTTTTTTATATAAAVQSSSGRVKGARLCIISHTIAEKK